ncbi:MAG: hypothetical protein PHH60_03200, partial [Candidatus Margulisbacteria bacterium]|nr:hypothetical protein [Candidatus Margulisiibacteriota bacterium]
MDIAKIEETHSSLASEEISLRGVNRRPCIYDPEVSCAAPNSKFKICQDCPRMAHYLQNSAVHSIFNYIKAFAVSF